MGPLPVTIDIKPGSFPNSINPAAAGVIPLAVLGTVDFNAATMNPSTPALEDATMKVAGKSGNGLCHLEYVSMPLDGRADLVCQFTNETVLTGGSTVATLTGTTFDGVRVSGSDTVTIVHE